MSLNEIKTKIVTDARGLVSGTKDAWNAVNKLETSFKMLNSQMQQTQRLAQRTQTSVSGLNTTLVNMSAAFQSFERFQNIFSSVLSGAYNYNKVLETNAVGIGGILTSMVKVNGKQLEWNESMAMSTEIMNKLRKEALRTSSTAPELIDTFRGLLGPGLGAGMNIDEIMRLTTVGVNAVKAIGLNGPQLIQELRGLVQGGIKPASSTLATALGLKDKDIKAARASSEGLFRFLMKRLEGFDKSVKATAQTVQGRLDIMKEGFYQGVGEGTKGLWKDFSDEIKLLSENFLTFNKEKDQMELNPKFVEQVKSVAKTVTTIKDMFSGMIGGLTSDASSVLKALFLGVGTKLGISALNSIVNITTKGTSRFSEFANSITESSIRLRQLENVEKGLGQFTEKLQLQAEQQQRLNEFVGQATKGIYNLNKRYQELGATKEQALKLQNQIVSLINKGASAEEIKTAMANYEQLAISYKTANEQKLKNAEAERLLNEQNLAIDKERLEIKKLTDKYQKEAAKGLLGAINTGKQNANAEKKQIESLESGRNNPNSLYAFEQKLKASAIDRVEQEKMLLKIKQQIWNGDIDNAIKEIENAEKLIIEENEKANAKKLNLEYDNAIAKVQREQFEWLNKQIEASVKLEQAKPKINEEQQRFNLLRNSVKETIALANAQERAKKLSKDGAYVDKWLSGKTKSKAFTDENKAMVTDLIAKMKEAGFSQAKTDEMAKSFINQLQSAKVSADRIKQVYETTTQELVNIKERYAQIQQEGQAILTRAQANGLSKEQAEKLRQSYVETMTNAGTESAKAWRATFDKEIQHVAEKINGVSRGFGANNAGDKTPTFTNAERLAHTQKEMELNFQRTMQNYRNISNQNADIIISTFKTIADAQNASLLSDVEADKLRLEYKKLVADGYMEEALAVQKVIEAQYEEGRLAGEKAQQEREKARASGEVVAKNKEVALTLERIAELNGNVLTSNHRNAMSAALSGEMQRKGYVKAEQALQALLKMEHNIGEEIQKTGGIAPPIYEKITLAIKKLIEAERELTEAEEKEIQAIIKQGEGYSKLGMTMEKVKGVVSNFGGALTSLGFTLQMCGIESDSATGKFAESAITIGFVSTSVMGLVDNLKELWKTLTSIKALNMGAILGVGGKAVGIGASVGLAATYVKLLSEKETLLEQGINIDKPEHLLQIYKERYTANTKEEAEEMRRAFLRREEERQNQEDAEQYNLANGYEKGNIELNNPPTIDDSDKKAAAKAEKARRALDSYTNLADTLKAENNKLSYSFTEAQKENDDAQKKVDAWKKSLNAMFVDAGGVLGKNNNVLSEGDITKKKYEGMKKSLDDYLLSVKEHIKIKEQEKANENDLQHIQNMADMNKITTMKANELRVEAYKKQMQFYEDEMAKCGENAEKRIYYEKKVAEASKAILEASKTDMKVHWDDVLNHIKNTTFNQTEVVKSTFDGLLNTFTNFGQNLLTENKKLSDRVKDLFYDFANNIMNMMMKMIMQGLAMQAILGIGNLFGKTPTTTSYGKTSSGLTFSGFDGKPISIPKFAKGGIADGWSLVGEKGPELVNFSNPARVYTADQTRNALSGNNGNLNVMINLKNESGQQIEAQQTGSGFDGENYVVGVVLRAISTNRNGMRNIIQGVARA